MPPDGASARRTMGVGPVERQLLLRTFPGFIDLEPELVAVLAEHVRERFFPVGTHLFKSGEPVLSVYLIVRGRVEVRRHGRYLREVGEKGSIGGIAAFAGDAQGYDCIAKVDTLTLEMRNDDVIDIFEDHFAVLRNVLRGIARELIELRRQLPGEAGFTSAEIEAAGVSPPRPLDLVERMALMRQTMTFAKSRFDAVADLAREAEEVRAPAGTVLWREGDVADSWIIVVSGLVSCRSSTGQHFRFGPGDVMGTLDTNARAPRWFTAETLTEVVGLRLTAESFSDVAEDNFEMAMDVLRTLSQGVLMLLDRLQAAREENQSETRPPSSDEASPPTNPSGVR